MSIYAKLRFISRHGTETLYIAQIFHLLRAVNGDGDVLRLAVFKLYAASYGLPNMRATEDLMTASVQGAQPESVLAVDISSLDTKLVTAKEGNKRFGLVLQKYLRHGIDAHLVYYPGQSQLLCIANMHTSVCSAASL